MNYTENYNKLIKYIDFIFPENNAVSFPVPQMENGIKENVYFISGSALEQMNARPFAVVKTAMEDGTFLYFQNCFIKDIVDTTKHPFSEKIDYSPNASNITIEEFIKISEKINTLYSRLCNFVFDDSVSDEDKETALDYKNTLFSIVPKSLIPYYESIGEQFLNWLEKI